MGLEGDQPDEPLRADFALGDEVEPAAKQGLRDALHAEYGEVLPDHARTLIAAGYSVAPQEP